MSAIAVHRWRNRYRLTEPEQAARVAAWDAALAGIDVAASVRGLLHDDEIVCVRRLRLEVRLRDDDGAPQLRDTMGSSLAAEISRVLREGDPANVVRYRDRREALADLLYRAAAGDLRRAWAWSRAQLLPPGREALTRGEAVERAVTMLAEAPAWIRPVLAHLLRAEAATGAWTQVARALGNAEWGRVLAASPHTRELWSMVHRDVVIPAPREARPRQLGAALLAWVAAHPEEARRISRELAVLVAAELEMPGPRAGGGPLDAQLAAALASIEACCAPRAGRSRARRAGARAEKPATVRTTPPHQATMPVIPAGDLEKAAEFEEAPSAPDLPPRDEPEATRFAGLLFLLSLLADTEALDGAEDVLPALLHTVAVEHAGAPADDPAVLAFCGDWHPPPGCKPSEDLRRGAAHVAKALRESITVRLGLTPCDPEPFAYVCERPGVLRIEPGWIELVMSASSADTRIRRSGLDLDPGWLPWLGCVVRFRYE